MVALVFHFAHVFDLASFLKLQHASRYVNVLARCSMFAPVGHNNICTKKQHACVRKRKHKYMHVKGEYKSARMDNVLYGPSYTPI